MYNKNILFDYYNENSIIHRLNPIYKILSSIFMIVFIVLSRSVMDYIIVNLFILVMIVLSDININMYLNNLRVCKIFILVLFIVGFCVGKSVLVGLLCVLSFVDLVVYLSVMVMTSSFNSIIYGVEKLLSPFNKSINTSEIAMKVGLFSKFISVMQNENIRVRNSKELRGVLYRDMSFWDRIVTFCKSFIPIYKNSMYKIKKIENSMRIRNYGYYLVRYNYRLNKFGKTDTIMLGINVVVLIVIMIY